jgi:HPr kinase/phosphorylase
VGFNPPKGVSAATTHAPEQKKSFWFFFFRKELLPNPIFTASCNNASVAAKNLSKSEPMHLHASCAARSGPGGDDAILLAGPSGAGKSDLLLRLVHAGWALVADDQVIVENNVASAPAALAGMLEVRGLGLFVLPHLASAPLRLVIRLGVQPARLPEPERDAMLDLPSVTIDAASASAVERITLALDVACGRIAQIAGAFVG